MSGRELVQASTAAEAAATWWAQQIGAPTFDAIGNTGSPKERQQMGMAGMLAGLLADQHPVTAGQAQRFVGLLAERISKALPRGYVSLAVDYGPCLELAEPANAAGIDASRFPWKTHMAVYPDHVVASLGYGASSELVWHAPDWTRPACAMQRYVDTPDGDYQALDELCGRPRYHPGGHGDWQPDARRCKGCGLSYSQHYAAGRKGGFTHSWEPEVPS